MPKANHVKCENFHNRVPSNIDLCNFWYDQLLDRDIDFYGVHYHHLDNLHEVRTHSNILAFKLDSILLHFRFQLSSNLPTISNTIHF